MQFESATEQLGTMIRQLLDKVSDQEQDWHRVVRKLSTEMDCKVSGLQGGGRRCFPVLSDPLPDISAAEPDRAGLGEEAAGRPLEEHHGEAAGSGGG